MISYKKQNRIIALIVLLIKNKSFNSALIGLTFLFLAVASWMFFPTSSSGIHYYTLVVYMILVVGLVIVISFKKELSIPFLSAILTREFYRIKFKFTNKKPLIIRMYLEFLHFLILTFKNSEDGFNDLKDELLLKLEMILNKTPENDLDHDAKRVKEAINKMKNGEDVDQADIDKMEKELLRFTEFKQKRTKKIAIIALLSLLVTITVSSLIFPQAVKTRAASFGFLQTDWSGGASTTATALHPGNETGWTTYFSKDGVSTSTPGQLSLNLTATNRKTETDNTDWQTHATSSTYYVGGSVGIIKPNGATCSSVVECSSGLCVDGYCCNAACSATCQACNIEGNEGTCTGINADEDTGCASACYDCVAGSCVATTEADDGTCVAACTSCVAGSCANLAADQQPSGCNSSCQYCDGAGNCKLYQWNRSNCWTGPAFGPMGENVGPCKASLDGALGYGYNYGTTAACGTGMQQASGGGGGSVCSFMCNGN